MIINEYMYIDRLLNFKYKLVFYVMLILKIMSIN